MLTYHVSSFLVLLHPAIHVDHIHLGVCFFFLFFCTATIVTIIISARFVMLVLPPK